MCAKPAPDVTRWAEHGELAALFFLHGMALGMWFVPLSTVLDAHGLSGIKPYAFATHAVAAFVSPLVFGAMADRHASPVTVLRWLAVATAVAMAVAASAIRLGIGAGWVLALIQVHALCSAPTWSMSTTIVFARLRNARREFGPVRAMATCGWMVGCWVVSALGADRSPLAGYSGALVWLGVAAFTLRMPGVSPSKVPERLTLRQRLGLDALTLLRHPDHRVVFVTAALFSIPLAAFYPYAPPHLKELGLERTAAWMTLGQATEILAMFCLAGLFLKWRLKWIFSAGLACGWLRYSLCAMDGRAWVLTGIALHGGAFTLFLITAQIYIDERVDTAWRARAQALMYLMTSGVGNLLGYLGSGWWYRVCARPDGTQWSWFWGGLALVVALVLANFLRAYRGINTGWTRTGPGGPKPGA